MTILLTILSTIGALTICYGIARYYRNDNLFWLLATSLLAGMAGGAIFNAAHSNIEEKNHFNQVYNPTQVLPAASIDFYAIPGDSSATIADPVSKDNYAPARDSEVIRALSKSSEEIRAQPTVFNYHRCRGTPGMPFDTS